MLGLVFVVGDILTRVLVQPILWLRPSSRRSVLTAWAQGVAGAIVALLRWPGRARVDIRAEIPGRGGVLMVANHQSIVDIPVVFRTVRGGYPRYVVHYRYGKGIPLVSHMIRLYGHIPVYPGRTGRAELEELARTSRESTQPIAIFPEGHRTRDGEIRPWKRAGLDAFLSAREWEVYVVVLDGLCNVARIPDFLANITRVRCRVVCAGPFAYDGRGRESHDEFVARLHGVMCDTLAAMRSGRGPDAPAARARNEESVAHAVKAP